MKNPIIRLISMVLVLSLCFSMLPMEAFAWGKMTHTYTANLIEDEAADGFVTVKYNINTADGVKEFKYSIPQEYLDAIQAYPNMFRAGALGPDMYPDILTGQMYIHPAYDKINSGTWITYLCNSVNGMGKDTEGRKMTLSFTLGCILHYCGDLFGHDFVNTFAGGTFPELLKPDILDLQGERLNNILSHMSVEKYMDSLIYPTYDKDKYGDIDAPNEFITNVMVFNGSPGQGLASPYEYYPDLPFKLSEIESDLVRGILNDFFDDEQNNVPPHYTAFLALRNYVVSNAEEYREHMDPVSAIITRYNDEWLEDIDAGIAAFTEACDNISRRMVTGEKNPKIERQKQDGWKDGYNELVVLMHEAYVDSMDQEEADALRMAETLGVEGTSFFDEIVRDLVRKGIVTQEMLEQSNGSITIIKEEFSYWWDTYLPYMILPDVIVDGIEIPYIGAFINLVLLGPLWTHIKNQIKIKIAEYVVEECTGSVANYTGLSEEESAKYIASIVEQIDDRIEDPKLQLDHKDNPFKPSENNFAELEAYMQTLSEEQKYSILESDLDPLYNTLTMFQLMLMGPENYTNFIKTNSGVTQTAYQTTTARPLVNSLKVRIKTSDLYLSGTNDNIYLIVYGIGNDGRIASKEEQFACKLLDISGADDFEADDTAIYTVEMPVELPLERLGIALRKAPAFDFLPGITDDWRCENIRITPMFAGYEQTAPVDLGGVFLQGCCDFVGMNFQTALKAKTPDDPQSQTVTNLRVRIKVKDEQYAGTDSDIYLKVYNNGSLYQSVLLDKAMYNDLEQGDNDTYNIPVVRPGIESQGIPLNRLTVKFDHTGSDESIWENVSITPCYGSIRQTDAISVGGKTFEKSVWKPEFQKGLKKATYRQSPDLSQTATELKVQIDVANKAYAGTDDDIYLNIYSGNGSKLVQHTLLDIDNHNDLEQGNTEIYTIALSSAAAKIPLNEMKLEFEHTGLDPRDELHKDKDEGDEAEWDEVLVTAYNGSKALTDPISLGGTDFGEYLWDTDFQTQLKLHYAPIVLKYTTNLNGGLLSYMASLDGGEEWVNDRNELWSNTTLRKEIFFKIFKGFAPEIEYAGSESIQKGSPVEITLNITGMWNGVSNERRSQIKDFEHVYAVEGNVGIEVISDSGEVMCRASGCKVSDDKVSITMPYNDKLVPGAYDVKVTYQENTAKPVYADAEVLFEDAFYVTEPSSCVVRSDVSLNNSGTTSGGGTFKYGDACTLTAHPKPGYRFVEWRKGSEVVCTSASYTFTVTENCNFVAVLEPIASSFTSVINDGKATVELSRGEVFSLYVKEEGGTAPYTYEWQYLEPGKTSWKRGTTEKSAGMIGDDAINGRRWRVEVTDANGNKSISNEVTVVIKGSANATTGEKLAVKINGGEKEVVFESNDVWDVKTLVANVTGGVGYCSYKWYIKYKNSSEWQLVSEYSIYEITSNGQNDLATIKVEVTDSAGEKVTSDEVTVKFKKFVVN